MSTEQRRGVRDVKSAGRTVEVLEVLAALQGRVVTLRDLAERIDIPRSSLYALLQTLVNRGWVRTDATGSLYSIGIRALLVGTAYLDDDPRLAMLKPHMDALAAELGETLHFARLDGTDMVYLATRESKHYRRPFSRVGRRLPVHATSLGKATLAERTDEEVGALLPAEPERLTPNTLCDRDALLADLAETRRRGYAIDDGENTAGLHCIGVALRYDPVVTDALSCSIPKSRLTPELESDVIAALEEVRSAIETATASPALSVVWR
ncbi:IclR family transcriptional regulator [Actinoallomurus purpureus]|uniref:IclR family transcriptional regulator n=1 Tax=Actinoallomurus purpureus TaxID=478114 RepID=UPI002093E493|nr:IclR family transcriptional regulator [Actinoallomurus purpureus]MCO6009883.1 IclR family transcriptional regulator [Actinoallomurus purpureus]